jgi:hypothetical protein
MELLKKISVFLVTIILHLIHRRELYTYHYRPKLLDFTIRHDQGDDRGSLFLTSVCYYYVMKRPRKKNKNQLQLRRLKKDHYKNY